MTRRYTHQRTNTDRRSAQDSRPELDETMIYDAILDRLDDISRVHESSDDAHKGEKLTFTITQILTALVALITVGGSLLAAWVNINNQITSQKVGTDITIAQIQKDIATQNNVNKELHTKMDNIVVTIQGSIDKLSNRVEELDNTVSQLYNRTIPKK